MTKFYITTAIPYVNAKPHIGNAMDWLYADILARYQRARGNEVLFSVGADENGEKNLEKAEAAGLDPKTYVDQMAEQLKIPLEAYNIRPDRFVKTSDSNHAQRAQIIWERLSQYIYKGKYVGYYCVGCEEFKTNTHVKETNGVCPEHDRKYETLEEENHFFRLSAFSDQIKKLIESGELRIVPESRKNEILGLINKGLEDFSVSRPKAKLKWGVEVPGDSEYIIYIWFEALMNYLTLLGYPEHDDFKKFWPPDSQVIGKGVLRFHAAIWPAIILSLGIPLPKEIYAHGYWSINGREVSKTLGNVAYPEDLVRVFGTDASRYFNARYLPSHKDGDFTWQKMLDVYNNDLINGLGNVIQRTSMMIGKYLGGDIGENVPGFRHDHTAYHEALDNYRFDKALEWVFGIIDGVNKYLEQTKPWMLAKDESNKEHVKEILLTCVADLREVASLLSPFMPQTAEMVSNVFGGVTLNPPNGPVFPRVELPGELTAQGAA